MDNNQNKEKVKSGFKINNQYITSNKKLLKPIPFKRKDSKYNTSSSVQTNKNTVYDLL